MKGKVFSSSQDLYQDQAKILFDFYKDAAEKIVSQEEELEKEIGNSCCRSCIDSGNWVAKYCYCSSRSLLGDEKL